MISDEFAKFMAFLVHIGDTTAGTQRHLIWTGLLSFCTFFDDSSL